MLFSVIIPVYNAEKTLERCLDSLLQQAFSDYEIILVNDGSKDGSDAVCRSYAEKFDRVQYISKENGGVSSARNAGLDHAEGTYVMFVDSDDYVDQYYFSELHDAVSEDWPALVLFGALTGNGVRNGIIESYIERTREGIDRRFLQGLERHHLSSVLFRVLKKSVIDSLQLRFDSRLDIGEDKVFLFIFAMHCQTLRSVDRVLYYVDEGEPDSLSRKPRPYLMQQLLYMERSLKTAFQKVQHSREMEQAYARFFSMEDYKCVYSSCKELGRFPYTPKEKRRKIRAVCNSYLHEIERPLGIKCWLIALPVKLRMVWALELAITLRERQK